LKHFCKSYERNKEKQKKKRRKKIKVEKGPRETIRPSFRSQPAAHLAQNLNRYPSPLSISLTGGTRMSASSPPPFPLFSLETELAGVTPPH
jgi:hypothetical protein